MWNLGMIVVGQLFGCTGSVGLPDHPRTPKPEHPIPEPEEPTDPDESVKQKRDDLLREVFG